MRSTRITTVLGNHKSTAICQRLLEQGYGLLDRVPLILSFNLVGYLLKTTFNDSNGLGQSLQECYVQATEQNPSTYVVVSHWFAATQIDQDGPRGRHWDHTSTMNVYSDACCAIGSSLKSMTLITIHPDTSEILIWMPKELLPREEPQQVPDEPPRVSPLGSRDVSATGSVDDLPK